MEILKNFEDMVGKEIAEAVLIDCEEYLVLKFTDDSCVFIEPYNNRDCTTVQVDGSPELYIQLYANLITEDEYDQEQRKNAAKYKSRLKVEELAQLKMLKEKYENHT